MENEIKNKDDSKTNDNFNNETSLKKGFMVDVPSPFKYKEPEEIMIKKKEDLDNPSLKKNLMLWSTIKGYAGSSTIHGFSSCKIVEVEFICYFKMVVAIMPDLTLSNCFFQF